MAFYNKGVYLKIARNFNSSNLQDYMKILTSPYEASPYRYGVERNYMYICSAIRGKVLDVGCGSGQYHRLFPNSIYVGLDITVPKKRGSNMVRGDATHLPFKGGIFDAIFCNAVLEHIKNDDQAINEMSSVLRSNGKIVVGVPTVFSICFTLNRHGYHYYTKQRLVEMMQRHGFEIQRLIHVGGILSLVVELLRNLYTGFPSSTITGNSSDEIRRRRSSTKLSLAKRINAVLLKLIDKIDLPAMSGGLIVVGRKASRMKEHKESHEST